MKYQVTLTFNPDELIATYCDNQGIFIEECDLDLESILEEEVSGWLSSSEIYVLNLEEVIESGLFHSRW